jgi:hypothetical protein
MSAYSDGPVWRGFGLTRAAYAVFPRRCLQSMPVEWQERFMALVNEMHERLPEGSLDGDYTITLRINGRIAADPMREYRHTGPLPPAAREQGGQDGR